ncbi:MAG: right-handed parallel beta-helix repeat-containing protein [Actinobacteria bacterium]|nr:right-handed parallel beta-helix repeat-containing protein [Actinomycetota bacterium]
MSDPPIALRMLLGLSAFALVFAALSVLTLVTPNSPDSADLGALEEPDKLANNLLLPDGDDLEALPSQRLRQLGVGLALPPEIADDPEPSSTVVDTLVPETTTTTAPTSTAGSSSSTTGGGTSSTSPTTSPPATFPQGSSGPITINGESNLLLENLSISNPNGACVRIIGSSNVTIRNSTIGPCGDWGVFIDKSSGVTIQGVTIQTSSSKGGIYGHSSSGIAVVGNHITSSGRNPVQFDKVTGAGNRIESNTITNSRAEDMISIFKSSGTSGSWLRVTGNTLRDNTGQSNSGSGIMLGDAGGSYVLVQGNSLTNPGQAGIGVAGGSNIRVVNNTVSSAQFPWSNVGIYVWNQSGGSCGGIEVRGNTVNWLNSSGQSNPAWDGGGCGSVAGWNENSW